MSKDDLPHQGLSKKPEFERDPFPLMITVCIIITIVLSFVIGGVLLLDLSRRHERPGDDVGAPSLPTIVQEAPHQQGSAPADNPQ